MDKKIKYTLLAALGAAAAAVPVKAALFKPEKVEVPPMEDEKVDLNRFRKNLSDAIKFKTIADKEAANTDWTVFDAFHDFLKERYPLMHEKLELTVIARGSLVFRWKGTRSDLDPIALLSHQDVVPISEGTLDDWKHDPFEGVDDGEFIWGRGALDMKNHLIGVLESVETLLSEGFVPERDVYILLGHNEEVMCATSENGATCICNYLKEKGVHLDAIIDEGGAILPVEVKGVINKHLAGIGVAEKGYADVEVAVTAKGGHSSQAPNHTAIGHLADVIKDIENHQFKAKMSPMMRELFDKIGRNCTYPARLVTCNLKLLEPALTKAMSFIPPAASMLRTTFGITMASGSPQANVLPQRASVTVNFRMFPGQTVDDVLEHLHKVIKNKKVEINLLPGWKNPSAVSPTDTRSFKVIEKICHSMDDKAVVAPYLVMGGTDACHYQAVCENIYRYSPFLVSTSLLLTTHGTNERIPVSVMEDAVKFFKRYIRLASAE
ncbi:MAG: M20/M25/M40 family metallo-hydrolase [Oscillospiraceae bacterium]|nr:M20/M25/M40 family metallo-hydrolase [Oscillospiraceae bacterium]